MAPFVGQGEESFRDAVERSPWRLGVQDDGAGTKGKDRNFDSRPQEGEASDGSRKVERGPG